MKTILISITLILLSNTTFSQDKITTKEGTNINVKIIYVDNENIYFYQALDVNKNIRKVDKKYISGYEYNSIENGKNKEVIASDSILFAKYLKNTKGLSESVVIKYENINTFDNDSLIKENNRVVDIQIPMVNQKFRKAGKQMIVSSVLTLTSVMILSYININNLTDLDKIKNLQYASALCAVGSWGFGLGAGINIYNGSLLLK